MKHEKYMKACMNFAKAMGIDPVTVVAFTSDPDYTEFVVVDLDKKGHRLKDNDGEVSCKTITIVREGGETND